MWRAAYLRAGVTNIAANTDQQTQYYPSGLPWSEGVGAFSQPYKYNGKEFIEMHGYDTYDYGARGYYPALGRFTSVDPLAEKYYSISPYAYCAGNPVNSIDPNGMEMYITHDPDEIKDALSDLKARYGDEDNNENNDDKKKSIEKQKQKSVDSLGNLLNMYYGFNNQVQTLATRFLDLFTKNTQIKTPNGVVLGNNYQLREWVPEYYGLSLSGSMIVGFGFKGSINLGLMPSDGVFFNTSFGSGSGFDISLSLQGSTGQYKGYTGESQLDAKSLTGGSWDLIGGAGLWNTSQSKGYTLDKNGGQLFNNWTINNGGLTIGSKTIFGGSYGPSVTSLPLYLYQFKYR